MTIVNPRPAAARVTKQKMSVVTTTTSSRALLRSSGELTRCGGPGKLHSAMVRSKKPVAEPAPNLADDTSCEEAEVESASSTASDNVPGSTAHPRILARRRKTVRSFSSLGVDGMSTAGDGLSFLELSSVSEATRTRYLKELALFLKFSKLIIKNATDAGVQNWLLRYLHALFLKGHSSSKIDKFLAAFLFAHPEFGLSGSRHAGRFFRAVKGYRKRCPAGSRKPRTFMEVCCLANDLVRKGQFMMAVFLLISFGCYFRPHECMSLRVQDLVPPLGSVTGMWMIVMNPSEDGLESKVGIADESLAWDVRDLKFMEQVFQVIVDTMPGNAYLFDFPYYSFAKEMRQSCVATRLPDMVPYQIRHSAPSWDRLQGYRTLQEIGKRGRWSARSSLNRYEKHGMVLKEYRKLPELTRTFAESCRLHLSDVILRVRLPLMAPWSVG